MKNKSGASTLVYSTETGRICPGCGQPVARCECGKKTAPPADGVVRVSLETKGRKGKGVTLVKGAPLAEDELAVLGKQLKAACGTGGTVKEGVIEVQGDHRDKVAALLLAKSWTVKKT
jgi:translation initiation factor 1